MSTPAAGLTAIGRIDSNVGPASFFRFAGQFAEKFRPTGIMNALRKTVVMRHAVDLQVFHTDDPKGIDDLAAFLMGEVISSKGDALMHTSYCLPVFTTLRTSFRKFAVFTLDFGQGLLFLAEKAGVVYLRAVRESSKRLESHVYPYLSRHLRQSLRVTFNRKGSIPLAGRGTADGEGFDLATNGPMQDNLEMTDARSIQLALGVHLESRLRVGDAVIAALALETREAWFCLMGFDPSKEGFHGKVKTHRHILQHLGVNSSQGGTVSFQYRKGGLLLIEGERETLLLIDLFASLQQMVIEPTTLFKRFVEFGFLLLGGVYPILKRLPHVQTLAQSTAGSQAGMHYTAASKYGRDMHPCL